MDINIGKKKISCKLSLDCKWVLEMIFHPQTLTWTKCAAARENINSRVE